MLIKIRYPSTVTIIILNKPDEYLMILRKKKKHKGYYQYIAIFTNSLVHFLTSFCKEENIVKEQNS